MPRSRFLRWSLYVVIVYSILLGVSTVFRFRSQPVVADNGMKRVEVQAVANERPREDKVSIAYQDFPSKEPRALPPVLFLHGSPGHGSDFELVVPQLGGAHRVVSPDLPGFGRSTRNVPDYSIRSHAVYAVEFLDALKIDRVHIVGFSMGAGVALDVFDMAPQRVASLTMLSGLGVQEMELLGDYHLNHLIHGVQLVVLYWLRDLTPHFGYLDNVMLGVEYGRNFYDTDQRPLREILKRYDGPMLILHGKHDGLVPVEAALEHRRLVPQSELILTEEDHFMIFLQPQIVAPPVRDFLSRADAGEAKTRSSADPLRIAEASRPMSNGAMPKAVGVTAAVIFVLLAIATLVSEDLACIGGGLMVAQGRAGFLLVTIACLLGIYVGDMLLFAAGRFLGRPALRHAPLKWFVSPAAVEQASAWFERRGAAVILISRFVPGMRLPTYFASGVLNTSFWHFSLYFLVACLIWTPLLVSASMFFGGELVRLLVVDEGYLMLRLAVVIVILYLVIKLLMRLASNRGRRLILSKWKRLTQWEFWPRWVFYPPLFLYILLLALKYRSLTLFTLANPAIPAGGFIGESKSAILDGLLASGAVARYVLIKRDLSTETRLNRVREFIAREGLTLPVVLKPDVGQRGDGVVIAKTEEQIAETLSAMRGDVIVQEFIGGEEYGIFYYRFPTEQKGDIFAITDKRFPTVIGDGRKTLEELILRDRRAVSMARFFLHQESGRLHVVPPANEVVRLVELGTHCRGAVFLDGISKITPSLTTAVETISRSYEGFYFGRYDIRVPSAADLSEGRNLKVIELNGVTSEATSIYDPGNSLRRAYQVLFSQWRIAFEIGAQHRARGLKPATVRELLKAIRAYRSREKAQSVREQSDKR